MIQVTHVSDDLNRVAKKIKEFRVRQSTLSVLGVPTPRSQVPNLPPEGIAFLRKRLGLSQEQFANWLNVSTVSLSRWERAHGEPSHREARTLGRLAELVDAVGKQLTSREMVRFFGEPHDDLYNDRPVDVLASELGYHAVRRILEGLLTREYA